jgi:hypothetical protein
MLTASSQDSSTWNVVIQRSSKLHLSIIWHRHTALRELYRH